MADDYPWPPMLSRDMKQLWYTYMNMEKYEEADQLCEQIFDAIEDDYEEQGIILIELLNRISYMYGEKQKFDQADKEFEEWSKSIVNHDFNYKSVQS